MNSSTTHDRRARVASLALLATTIWFVPWLIAHANMSRAWLTVPFVAATLIVVAASLCSAVNRWHRAVPDPAPVAPGAEPMVAVIIPTLREPLAFLEATVRSVLDQDWPADRLWVLVSDDGADERVRELVNELALAYPRTRLRYHRPPPRGNTQRKGDAKAGNLNSALAVLPADIRFIETRDADDLVAEPRFLRETVGQLLADYKLAFVQTIKTGEVSPHDPFDNQQPHFFQCAMLSRHAANAVFSCGSGVVWRRLALHDIGGFPTWNLVEDLQSGVEVLRRGWHSCYLPIVGAYAQHSPEDLANFVKQRGTWALDTVRLMLWLPKRGLNLRQRLQFYELGLFYMQGPATLVFLLAPILGFAGHWYPVLTTTQSFVLHFWPFAVALELYLASVHRPVSLEQMWRARLVWAGLCFVYAGACLRAVIGGRSGKPRYVVTRKENRMAWHWRHVVPHFVLLVMLAASVVWSLAHRSLLTSFDVGSAYWAGLYSLLLLGFIRLSWHGIPTPGQRLLRAGAAVMHGSVAESSSPPAVASAPTLAPEPQYGAALPEITAGPQISMTRAPQLSSGSTLITSADAES